MSKINLAYFISSHGYGHAARACAVMNAILQKLPDTHFLIFTQAPQWFFEDSLPKGAFTYIETFTDVGFVQQSPFREDLSRTLQVLGEHLPFSQGEIASLAAHLSAQNCKAVFCDVSALGILTAQKAQIPSVLIENFTWDWLYRHYEKKMPGFAPFADYLNSVYATVTLHIQTIPFTHAVRGAMVVPPVSRRPKHTVEEIRSKLGIPFAAKAVLISTGGIKTRHKFLDKLEAMKNIYFIVPHDVRSILHEENVIVLPHHSQFYHPDLVLAADTVVCKSGYSTVAEAYFLNKPLMLVTRPYFPESPFIEAFVKKHFVHRFIEPECFNAGDWLDQLTPLLENTEDSRQIKTRKNGVDNIINIIREIIK